MTTLAQTPNRGKAKKATRSNLFRLLVLWYLVLNREPEPGTRYSNGEKSASTSSIPHGRLPAFLHSHLPLSPSPAPPALTTSPPHHLFASPLHPPPTTPINTFSTLIPIQLLPPFAPQPPQPPQPPLPPHLHTLLPTPELIPLPCLLTIRIREVPVNPGMPLILLLRLRGSCLGAAWLR